jgi:SAM-dependent methyltransferase
MDGHEQVLRHFIERSEADVANLAKELSDLMRFPLSRKAKAALRQGLVQLESLRQAHMTRVHQYRNWQPGSQPPTRPILPPAMVRKPPPVQKSVLSRKQYLNDLDARNSALRRAMTGFGLILSARRQPLYAKPMPKPDLRSEQLAVSDRVFKALHWLVNPAEQEPSAQELGCFPDIPLLPSTFLAHAHAAARVGLAQGRSDMRFLDVGCGGGVKVMLAAEIFHQADGLEYDPGYVAAAQTAMRTVNLRPSRVFEADALNFEGYADYDVIYFYQPMNVAEQLQLLERRIVVGVPAGTILIAPYQIFAGRAAALGCGHIAGSVYVSGTGQAQADALRAKAEAIGIDLIDPRLHPSSKAIRENYLSAMVAAAQRIGHDVS